MSLTTENLFDRLDSIIKDLWSHDLGIRSHGGGGYRCSTLMWKTEEKGDFSFANLIMDLGYIKSIEIDEFIDELEEEFTCELAGTLMEENYNSVMNLIDSELEEIKVYQVIGEDKYEDSFNMIIGQTNNHKWIGLAPLLSDPENNIHFYCRKKYPQNQPKTELEDLELKVEIESYINILEFPINPSSYRESEGTVCAAAKSLTEVIERTLIKSRTLAIGNFANFHDEYLEEGKTAKYEIVNEFIDRHFTQMYCYSMGIHFEANLYFIGETRQKDYLIIRTQTSLGY